MAEFAHNSWRHEHTRNTPHKLLIGINPTASINIPEDLVPAAHDRLAELTNMRKCAQQALQRCIKIITPPCIFALGDKVWLDAQHLKFRVPSKKLAPQRYGPFKVLKQISPVTYQLLLPSQIKIHNVFHVDLLTPYVETQAYGENYPQPPPEIIDGEEEYKVEMIIDDHYIRQGQKRKKQFLVKWEGYPRSKNSWVNAEDIHAPRLLADYQARIEQAEV